MQVKFVQDVTRAIRQIRSNFLMTKERPQAFILLRSEDRAQLLEPFKESIAFLAHCEVPEVRLNQKLPPEGCAVEVVDENCEVFLLVKGLVDIAAEIAKLEKKNERLQMEHEKLSKTISSSQYHKTPEAIRVENASRLEAMKQEMGTLSHSLWQTSKSFCSANLPFAVVCFGCHFFGIFTALVCKFPSRLEHPACWSDTAQLAQMP